MTVISAPRSPRKRRQYSPEFKAKIVAACQQPGVSVSGIALDNGLNANLVRRWISEAKKLGSVSPAFVPINLPAPSSTIAHPSTNEIIRIQIPRRIGGAIIIEWPAAQASQCLVLLRDLLR